MKAMFIAAALASVAAPAWADRVARTEMGAIEFSLAAPVGLETPALVNEDAAAWTETLQPRHLVRTTSDGVERIRYGATPGSTAGTLMFGYNLASGMAYCPPLTIGPGSQRVQCLRDFDGDGTFDGSYATPRRGQESVLLVGQLSGLTPMPKVSYEIVDPSLGPTVPAQMIFRGWQNGQARFRLRVQQEWTRGDLACEPNAEGVCDVMGVYVRVTRADNGAARVELVGVNPNRRVNTQFSE